MCPRTCCMPLMLLSFGIKNKAMRTHVLVEAKAFGERSFHEHSLVFVESVTSDAVMIARRQREDGTSFSNISIHR